MGNYVKGHHYWSTKQENLCRQWLSATTDNEYTRIHNALLPQLNFMADLILNRYFTCPTARQREIKIDAVQHVFLLLKKYQPDKGKSGSYNFCGMVIKHFFLEELILDRSMVKHIENKTDYLDDYPENYLPLTYEENKEIDYNGILKHFKTLIKERDIKIVNCIKRNCTQRILTKYNTEIEILQLCYEYVEKFQSLDATAMVDYVFLNKKSTIHKATLVATFRSILKINGSLNLDSKDRIFKNDLKHEWFEDDYVPNVNKLHLRQTKKRYAKKFPDLYKFKYF